MGGRSHARREGGRRQPGFEDGLSLIEVVIAFTILMIVLVPVASLLANTIGQAASSRERLTALSLAEQYIELLNNTPLNGTVNATPHDANLPVTNTRRKQTTTPLVRSTVAYTVYAEFTWTTPGHTQPDLCTSGLVPTVLDLEVTVEWSSGERQVSDTTLIDYPPAGIPTNGFLAIEVDGDPVTSPPADAGGHAWSTRVEAVPVTITPEPTVTGYTTAIRYPNKYGCVFEEAPPGNYAISVADPSPGTPSGTSFGTPSTPSWVSTTTEGTSQAKSPFTVSVGAVTTASFTYDEGSMVSLTYPTTTLAEGDVTCPGKDHVVCVVTGQSPQTSANPSTGAKAQADLSVLTTSSPVRWTVEQPAANRLAATACAGTTRCVSVGYKWTATGADFVGASVSANPSSSSPTFSSDAVPAGVTGLQGVTCPATTVCIAWGQATGGAVILSGAVSSSGITWKVDNGLSGVSTVSAVTCSGATTCDALGTGTAGPEIFSEGAGDAWVTDTLPATLTVRGLTQVTCPGSRCFAIGSGISGAVVLSTSTAKPTTWLQDTVPSVSSLAQIRCPGAATCYAIGSTASSAIVVSLTTITATRPSWVLDTVSGTVSTLSALQCPSTTVCYAAGSNAAGPLTLSFSSTPTQTSPPRWRLDTSLPTGITKVSALKCPSTTHCLATATATVSGSPRAVVLSLASSTKWATDTLQGAAPVYFAGLACTGSTCVAPGASVTAAVFLDGTTTSTTWTADTPTGTAGMYLADTPISVFDPDLKPATSEEMAAPASNVSQIGPLFPFASGYSVAAAECGSGVTETASTVSTTPGGRTATAALAMGLLPIQVVTTTGVPVSGAHITASPTCTPLTPPSGETNPTSFTLESTGPLGTSALAVMYGTYTVTVTAGAASASVTVTVDPTTTLVAGVSHPLPVPVEVTLS